MEDMDMVIRKLTEIEHAAVSVCELAAAKKKELAAEYEKKTLDFDETMDRDTNNTLAGLRETLRSDMEQNLATMRSDARNTFEQLKHEYETNHAVLANEILQQLIKE